jgi:hypothetical protein
MRRLRTLALAALVGAAFLLPGIGQDKAQAKPNDTVVTGFCVTGPADANGPLAGNPHVHQGYMPHDPYGYGVPYGTEQGALLPQYAKEFAYYHLHTEYNTHLDPLFAGASHADPVCVVLEGWEQHEPPSHCRGNCVHLQVHRLDFVGRGPDAINHAMQSGNGLQDPYCASPACPANRGSFEKERL